MKRTKLFSLSLNVFLDCKVTLRQNLQKPLDSYELFGSYQTEEILSCIISI